MAKIREQFQYGSQERFTWDQWFSDYAPQINDVDQYLADVLRNKRHLYTTICKSPFGVIFEKNKARTENPWPTLPKLTDLFNPNFEWPKILQAAMNSAHYLSNKNPPPARLGVEADAKLSDDINSFQIATAPYSTRLDGYDNTLYMV